MSLWLTKEELVDLTGFKHRKRQCLELARQGLQFRVRHDGFPLVDRWQFEQGQVAKGRQIEPNLGACRPRLRLGPDWDALEKFESRKKGRSRRG